MSKKNWPWRVDKAKKKLEIIKILLTDNHPPLIMPYLSIASIEYMEQEG
jgi:hypothetical protein